MFKLHVDETPLTEEELSYHKITVATVRGRPYYNITCALRLMELQFDSLSPEEAAVSNAKVIITTQDEAGIVNKKGIVMIDTELEKYPAIAKAKILRSIMGERVVDDQLIIGIDPAAGSEYLPSICIMRSQVQLSNLLLRMRLTMSRLYLAV